MPNSTNRQRVEELTKNAPCSSCHSTVSTARLRLRNLDGIGRYRTTDNGQPVNARGATTSTA